MSFVVSKYPEGTFSWADMFSTDAKKTKIFLKKLFNWESKDYPTPNGIDYTTFFKDGHSVAGLSQMPSDMVGIPSHWSNYVTVKKIEKTLEKVKAAGGTVFIPTMDVMEEGKMAGIQDPTGARLMLWQAKKTIGAELINTVGAMGWNELHTTDLKKAKKFYSDVFGWKFVFDKKAKYTTIMNKKRMNGGMMKIQPEWGDVPPNWMVYFTVADIKKTIKKVKKLGGDIHSKIMSAPGVGQFAVINEPTGAVFTIIQLETEPEEWTN